MPVANAAVYEGVNPMTGVSIPKGKKHGRKRLAYALGEVEKHLELFSGTEPLVILTEDGPYTPEIDQGVVRAAIGVATFAGLREGEIRGQWWEDDDGDVLNIRRSVWRTHLKDETKTHEDDDDPGVVPIIEPLRFVLDAIKPEDASGWMFPNRIGGALGFGQPCRPCDQAQVQGKRVELERLVFVSPAPSHEPA
jgi:hypothetical protein